MIEDVERIEIPLAEFLEAVEPPDGLAYDEPPDEPDGEPEGRWRVTNEAGAVWVMRKLAGANARLRERARVAQLEIDRIHAWLDDANKADALDVAYFDGLLREWAAREIQLEVGANVMAGEVPDADRWKHYKRKTIRLPHGEITARAGRGSFNIGDSGADVAIDFLVQHERDDLLTIHEPTIGGSKLDAACDNAPESCRFDGEYFWIPVAEDHVADSFKALAIKNQGEHNERVTTVIDTFVDVLPNAFAVEQETPNADERLSLTVEQQLGEEAPIVTTWQRIPGVMKTGKGVVSITVKTTDDD